MLSVPLTLTVKSLVESPLPFANTAWLGQASIVSLPAES